MSARVLHPVSPVAIAPRAAALASVAGESRHFDAIYDAHFAFVWRVARSAGAPYASLDDVAQDVFVVVHRRLADYDGDRPIRAWLYGIVMRVVADHRRAFRRKEARLVPQPSDAWEEGEEGRPLVCPRPAPSEQAECSEALRLVFSLLERMPEDKRQLLVLAQIEEMSVPEIAECLEMNVNTAYARLRAARREFDALYAQHQALSGETEGGES